MKTEKVVALLFAIALILVTLGSSVQPIFMIVNGMTLPIAILMALIMVVSWVLVICVIKYMWRNL